MKLIWHTVLDESTNMETGKAKSWKFNYGHVLHICHIIFVFGLRLPSEAGIWVDNFLISGSLEPQGSEPVIIGELWGSWHVWEATFSCCSQGATFGEAIADYLDTNQGLTNTTEYLDRVGVPGTFLLVWIMEEDLSFEVSFEWVTNWVTFMNSVPISFGKIFLCIHMFRMGM